MSVEMIVNFVKSLLFAEPVPEVRPEQKKTQMEAELAWMRSCDDNLQPYEMICDSPPTGFDCDEQVIFCLPSIKLMEARAVRYSQGGYGGSSIRIMKGLSIRTGGTASQSQTVDQLTGIDSGTLVLTSKRLVFLGAIRTNSVKLQDIISTQSFLDGIELHRERKQKVETYVFTQPLTILEGSGAGLPVNGFMISMSIDHAKRDYEFGLDKMAELRRHVIEQKALKEELNAQLKSVPDELEREEENLKKLEREEEASKHSLSLILRELEPTVVGKSSVQRAPAVARHAALPQPIRHGG